ncbi:Anthranilate synthase component 2 [Maioricimonas rarisocia]|uniref:Anthranilate synthase component 2 n=1 Tax=Maioricimonas rarisocia TaxID=2528026 RepID=A0A517Z3H6_9PLAN|nr:aminodeoxychorismate/anthranilate synthase component II [Maioricimonas rarisocia]QDU37044.1 Anthranilate synthase component 2 [Maioricimonas rarisocia]
MIVLIDNYDSFVFNLARYLEELGQETHVVRSDAVTVTQLADLKPAAIVLSPGPCTPAEAGISVDVVQQLGADVPTLGVCLGHQAIGVASGGRVVRAEEPMHGRTSDVFHDRRGLLAHFPNPFRAMRYHSLVLEEASLPDELRVTARTRDGIIMAVEHRMKPIWGVQFHPESVLTECGHALLARFLEQAGLPVARCRGSEYTPPSQTNDFYARGIESFVVPPPTSD